MKSILPKCFIVILTIILIQVVASCRNDNECDPGQLCYYNGNCIACQPCALKNGQLVGERPKCRNDYEDSGAGICPNYCLPAPPGQATLDAGDERICGRRGQPTTTPPDPVYNLTCPSNEGTVTLPGLHYANVSWLEPTLTPNDTKIVITRLPDTTEAGGSFPIGWTTIYYQAWKEGMVVANCSFDVIVDDIEPPKIECPSNVLILTSDGTSQPVDWGEVDEPFVEDNSEYVQLLPTPYPKNYKFPVGETIVTRTAEDLSGNSGNCSFSVIIKVVSIICPKDTPNNTWPSPVIKGDNNTAVYNCSHESGEIYGTNVTVNCDVYWKKKLLASCSFVASVPKPKTGEFSDDKMKPIWHKVLIAFLVILPVLTIAVIITLCYLRKDCPTPRWRRKIFCESDDEKFDPKRTDDEGTELMGKTRDANVGTISYQEREAPGEAEENKPCEGEFREVPAVHYKGHSILSIDDDNKPNGHIKPPYGSKIVDTRQTPESEEPRYDVVDEIPLDIKRPPADSMDGIDQQSTSSQSSTSYSSLPSTQPSTCTPPSKKKPKFRILYWTNQSVFIELKHFMNINNYELRYKCLENNNQQQETIIPDLRQFEDELYEITGLASNSLYKFTLQRKTGEANNDDSDKPITVKTSGASCNETIGDLLDEQDLMYKLCILLDPKESLWRSLGWAYGLTDAQLKYINFHKTPDTYPVTRQLFELIRDVTLGKDEERTIFKLLKELHYRSEEHGVAEAFEK
ncbi:uncharacterized protein [Amphiura filiformis]|uniref:uncharacterized protein n=1 Tax=Amphiura filiformis TaxID=82378 RepID=UPI003B2259EC